MIIYSVDYIVMTLMVLYLLVIYFVRRNIKISLQFVLLNFLNIIYLFMLYFLKKNSLAEETRTVSFLLLNQSKSIFELLMTSNLVFYTLGQFSNYERKIRRADIIVAILFVIDLIVLSNPISTILSQSYDYSLISHNLVITIHIISLSLIGMVYVYDIYLNRKKFSHYKYLLFIISAVLFALVPFALLKNKNTNAFAFSFQVSLYATYIIILNPGRYTNKHYHVLNKQGFSSLFTNRFDLKADTTYLLCKVKKVEFINDVIDENDTNLLLYAMLDDKKNKYGYSNVFYLEDETFLIIIKDFDQDAFLAHEKMFSDKLFDSSSSLLTVFPIYSKLSYKKKDTPKLDDIEDFINISKFASYDFEKFTVTDFDNNTLLSYKREKNIVRALKLAIINKKFEVFYQPIYNLKEKRSTGAEALVRYTDPILGSISPEEFIPIAEKYGIVSDIDEFVYKEVANFTKEYGAKLGIDYIDLNLSHAEASNENFVNKFINHMSKMDLNPSNFHLEITETSKRGSDQNIISNISRLRKFGYSFSLDDYGSGYASVDYLTKYNFDIIKIDKSILWGIEKNPSMYYILENIVKLGKDLSRDIIMEGVENKSHVDLLEKLGVFYMQGYYYSRPLCKEDYINFLEREDK